MLRFLLAGALWPLALGLLMASGPLRADISGTVVDDVSGAPLAGALVSIRARPDIAPVFTLGDGSFVLPMSEPDIFQVAAAVAYDPQAAVNYLTEAQQAFDGMSGIELRLPRLPEVDNPDYQPPAAGDFCIACHFSYYQQWSDSRHAGAAQNPWVLDLFSGTGTAGGSEGYVFRDTHDPDDSGFCATCHAPLEDVFQPGQVMLDEVSTTAGMDGVTCLACHQIAHVNADVDALHHLGNSEYRFPLAAAQTSFHVFGPLPDVDTVPMQNVWQPQFEDSRICAGCHEYTNPVTGAPGQNTYTEWLASPFAEPGPGFRTCQNCHMPQQQGEAFIGTGGPLRPGSQRHAHGFVGATPQTLVDNIDLRVEVEQQGAQVVLRAEVENQCGHHFPTGISIRNALLVLDVRLNGVPLAQLAGPTIPFWGSDDVPGEQPGDYAGWPGKGFARVLEGRINGQGPVVRPVLFIDAEGVHSDTTIPSGDIDFSEYRFALPAQAMEGDVVEVDARLLYRRAWRALAVTKGWTETPGGMPVEIEVQAIQSDLVLGGIAPELPQAVPIPVGNRWVLLFGLGLLAVLGAWRGMRTTR
jgi:hypothetical protein